MTTNRRSRFGALLAASALLLTACMKVDVDLTLNENDTADGVFIMGISDEVAEMVGQDPQDLWEQAGAELESGLPEGAEQEPYSEDGYTGTRVTFTEEPLAEASPNDGQLSITREGEEYVIAGAMDMTDSAEDMAGIPAPVQDSFQIRVAITFPGEVLEHNGDLEGNTVVWQPELGERNEISARGMATADGAGGVPWVWIAVSAVVLLALAGLITALVVRSRKQPSTVAGPGAPYGPPAPAQPAAAYGQPGVPHGQPGVPYGQPGASHGQPGAPYGQHNAPYNQPADQPPPPSGPPVAEPATPAPPTDEAPGPHQGQPPRL